MEWLNHSLMGMGTVGIACLYWSQELIFYHKRHSFFMAHKYRKFHNYLLEKIQKFMPTCAEMPIVNSLLFAILI